MDAEPLPAASVVPESREWEYHQQLRLGRPGWAWPLLGVVSVAVLWIGAQLVWGLLASTALLIDGHTSEETSAILAGDPVRPVYLAVVNLVWASMIPIVGLVLFALHRLRPGVMASVMGRIRWQWLLICLGLAAVTLLATLIVGGLVPAGTEDAEFGGHLNSFTSTTRDFLLVVVLLTPLQAAGEEYAFRGYLTLAFGRLASGRAGRALAVVVPAFLFALAHGIGQDLPVFVDRFAFGLVAGLLVVRTGGLEAGIAMHVLNNFVAFGAALAFSDMTTALNPTGGTWWSLPTTLTQSLLFLGLVELGARRRHLTRIRVADVLVGQDRRV